MLQLASEAVDRAVAQAYEVFAAYTPGAKLAVCHCPVCMASETERVLLATPLRELSSDLLAEYTNSAHGYSEGRIARDLRYFLPRYFDLIARDDPPDYLGLDTCLSRLGKADYRRRWPRAEIRAIDDFFEALFLRELERPVSSDDASMEHFLRFVAYAGADVYRMLELWDEDESIAATLHLARFVEDVAMDAFRGRLSLVWSSIPGNDNRELESAVLAWLKRPDVKRRLEDAFFEVPNPDRRESISRAVALLA